MCCSAVVAGSVRLVTGGVRIIFLGLSKQFRTIIKSLIRVIDRSRGKEKVCYLRLSIGPVVRNDRGNKGSDLSPHEGPALRILPRLNEYFFQALANEIMARGGDTASDSRHRRPIFRSDLAS
jgi:hypothetical protein